MERFQLLFMPAPQFPVISIALAGRRGENHRFGRPFYDPKGEMSSGLVDLSGKGPYSEQPPIPGEARISHPNIFPNSGRLPRLANVEDHGGPELRRVGSTFVQFVCRTLPLTPDPEKWPRKDGPAPRPRSPPYRPHPPGPRFDA